APLEQTTHAAVEDTTSKSAGCPGWPFPTLPCTDRFPALETQHQLHPIQPVQTTPGPARPSSAMQQPIGATSLLDRLEQALRQINCAALRDRISGRGSPIISGTVPDTNQKAKLVQLVAQFFPGNQPEINVDIV